LKNVKSFPYRIRLALGNLASSHSSGQGGGQGWPLDLRRISLERICMETLQWLKVPSANTSTTSNPLDGSVWRAPKAGQRLFRPDRDGAIRAW
jgi:hypothetical protein